MATIIQRIVFRNTKTKKLYDLYMNPKLHGEIVNGVVKISEKPGSKLYAFEGYITGKTIHAVKNKLIVQSWRASEWKVKDEDSVFMISLDQKGKDAIVHAVHANVPEQNAAGLEKGWYDHYWNPWKQYLAGKKITRPVMD